MDNESNISELISAFLQEIDSGNLSESMRDTHHRVSSNILDVAYVMGTTEYSEDFANKCREVLAKKIPQCYRTTINRILRITGEISAMVDGWIEKRTAVLCAKSQSSLVSILRQFSRFLCFLGMDTFVPDDEYNVHYTRYYPHLFTDSELEQLFDCFDSWKPNPYRPNIRAELVNPVLFRMLYCCGMPD